MHFALSVLPTLSLTPKRMGPLVAEILLTSKISSTQTLSGITLIVQAQIAFWASALRLYTRQKRVSQESPGRLCHNSDRVTVRSSRPFSSELGRLMMMSVRTAASSRKASFTYLIALLGRRLCSQRTFGITPGMRWTISG